VTAFSLSALPFNWKYAFRKNKIRKSIYDPNLNSIFIRTCLYIAIVLSIIFSTLTMVINDWDLESIFFNLLETSGRFAALRGNLGMEYGIIGILSIFFTYITPVLGGFVSYSQKTNFRKSIYFLVSLAPAIYTMIIQSSKVIFVIAISFYLASILLMKIYNNKLDLFNISYVPRFMVPVLLLIPPVLISFISREHNSDLSDLSTTVSFLIYSFASYALGQIYAFSDFFSFYIGMPAFSAYKYDFYSLGSYTFASVFDSFGFGKTFPPGLYEETVYFRDVFETNIFTIFRGLIYDFGGIGSIIFIFLFGLVLHAFYYRLLRCQKSWLSCIVFIATIVFIMYTYLMSVFMARYMFLNGLALYIILLVNSNISENSRT
jgi:oligosaccharide repeat unit polymerase